MSQARATGLKGMIIAHIAGVPVEETLLSLAPAGVFAVGAGYRTARLRLRRLAVRAGLGRRRASR
jgi:hypothetical protein